MVEEEKAAKQGKAFTLPDEYCFGMTPGEQRAYEELAFVRSQESKGDDHFWEDLKKEHAERRLKYGLVICFIQEAVLAFDFIAILVCAIIWPLAIFYLPIRFLAIGIWKLLGWFARAAGAEATRAVKAARTKARDFEKATRPE